MILKRDIIGCFFLLSISTMISFGVNAFSPNGIALKGQWDPDQGVVMAGANKTHAVDVLQINNPLKVKRLVESGTIIVLDVRWPEIYDQGHIPGALNFPLDDFEEDRRVLLSKITPEDEILVYCSGVTCHDSHTFAIRLVEMGFAHVAVYAGGFAEWEEMGFDVAVQGTDP
ncbi:MAG: rhodanese-like domain-containing protein [Desulfobacter sp.]|jgi:rhodanese-related sulfurtransferase|uniref:rhodanese-like domain-containing protein n=1 Tax=uncultured Desulfobacter sp. TaxID=240139 RepID=UPI0029C78DB4|nr:rhodanese-like domain-containing protein [uncultured Desulfobacter sp.]MCW8799328.1 rhodanese-like domain-containing protein [Desulfobacter sp.]